MLGEESFFLTILFSRLLLNWLLLVPVVIILWFYNLRIIFQLSSRFLLSMLKFQFRFQLWIAAIIYLESVSAIFLRLWVSLDSLGTSNKLFISINAEVTLCSYNYQLHSTLVGPQCGCGTSERRNRSCSFGLWAHYL